MRRALALATLLLAALTGPATGAEFRILKGHGGPIHAIAASGGTIATASFDNSVGFWREGRAPVWLEGHEAAVKAVASIDDARLVSAGDDGLIFLWDRAARAPLRRLTGHEASIAALAVSPDSALIASAGWDGRIGLWNTETGARLRWLEAHDGPVNDVAFGADGRLYSAGYDGTVREWRIEDGVQTRILARHGFGVNRLLVRPEAGWLAYGGLDGGTRVLALPDGAEIADLTLDRRPILAMAASPDGARVAVGDGEGYIMLVETVDWSISHDFRAAKRGPIWALAFVDGGASIAAGGIEDAAYVWPLGDGLAETPRMAEAERAFHTDPAAVGAGERQFLRKCSICHSLTPDGGRKAGPTLHGLFGRPAGAVPGYAYSDALEGAPIVWRAATIDKLFALGPDRYTPGSKMPMQQIASERDRGDLIDFLKAKTRPRGAPQQGTSE